MSNGTVSTYGKLALGGYPDELDAAVSTRLATTGYTAPDNAGIAALPTLSEIEASTVLAKETTAGSRLAAVDYVAPDNAGISALPLLAEIEASTILAKEATLADKLDASAYIAPDNATVTEILAEVQLKPALSDIEGSTVFAKQTTLDLVKKFLANRMKVDTDTNQLYLYDDDGVTVIKTFDLKDEDGAATSENVYDRVPEP